MTLPPGVIAHSAFTEVAPTVRRITVRRSPMAHLLTVVYNLTMEAIMADDKDLATEGAKQQLKGAAKQVEGRVRSTVGAATGDTSEQLKGKAQELKGKIQQGLGKAKQKADPEPGVDED